MIRLAHISLCVLLSVLPGCVSTIEATKDHPAAWLIEDNGVKLKIGGRDPSGMIDVGIELKAGHSKVLRVNPLGRTLEVRTGDNIRGTTNSADVGNYLIIRVGYEDEKDAGNKDRIEPVGLRVIEEPVVMEPVIEDVE